MDFVHRLAKLEVAGLEVVTALVLAVEFGILLGLTKYNVCCCITNRAIRFSLGLFRYSLVRCQSQTDIPAKD